MGRRQTIRLSCKFPGCQELGWAEVESAKERDEVLGRRDRWRCTRQCTPPPFGIGDDAVFVLDLDMAPVSVLVPCPSKVQGPFLTTDGTYIKCSLLAGHEGSHSAAFEWGEKCEQSDDRRAHEASG
jgi:hypothetical protein